jgi:phage baseplate assembly protein W
MASINFNAGYNFNKRDELGFKYKDISVPISRDPNNYDLAANFDLQAIKQSLRNIFDWSPGERILNPEFGNPLLEFMYEPINAETAQRIASSLRRSIGLWEPRVRIENLKILPKPDDNEYYIELTYSIPSLKITAQLYPMILSNG